jgi:hypothetical protein
LDEIFDLKIKTLVMHFVTNQTRLGKISSCYVLAVAGDGNGRLGIGEGKALEVDDATSKANQAAIRSMRPIPRYEKRTIYGEVEGKVGACEVQLKAKPPGTSIASSTISLLSLSSNRIWTSVSAPHIRIGSSCRNTGSCSSGSKRAEQDEHCQSYV